MPAVIPIAVGAAGGALSQAAPMLLVSGIQWSTTQVLIGAGVGAAMGAVGLMLQPSRPSTGSSATGRLQTTSIRNSPVPVCFGTVRMAGNYLALGNFHTYKDADKDTRGIRLRQMNAFLGLCEGPVQRVERFLLDGKSIQKQIQEVELPERFTLLPVHGEPLQKLPAWLSNKALRRKYGFDKIADPVPWRNTAYVRCGVNVGAQARLADINCLVTGPDLSIRRAGKIGDANNHDSYSGFHYDGYTESFYGTLSSSDRERPWGLVRTPRERGRSSQTQPPESVQKSIAKAWYLGKHDVLVMQDPDDCSTFHLGHWGIRRNGEWETVQPDPGYAQPILAAQLDELHGLLHTVHAGSTLYLMRWNLLTGRITRLDTDLPVGGLKLFTCAGDWDAYVVALADRLVLIDAQTGSTYHCTSRLDTDKAKGLCVTGSLIGLIYSAGIIYYDPQRQRVTKRFGNDQSDLLQGHFGGITQAIQNTFTGHVTMAKPITGTSAFINFIPAYPDAVTTYPIKKETKPGSDQPVEKEVRTTTIDEIGGVARDWSTREYNQYRFHALTGESSVAAALWNALVDEPCNDSGRWGAGLNAQLVNLSSIESLHAYCVGPVLYPYRKTTRYQERFKFDFLLDSERSAADLIANEILLCINGYRTLIDGQLYLGVQRTGLPSSWHFTEHQMVQDSQKLGFLGRAAGMNRVRVEYPDALDNYRRNFGEANDEFDQNVHGRIIPATLSANGITRLGHARNLAQQMIDAAASNRRQVSFKTHWLGYVLSPGDGIEVSSPSLGIERLKCRVVRIEENENHEIELTAIEHQPVRDIGRMEGEEDMDGSCAALAESAEFRHGLTMAPMHLGVYEDPDQPRLLPLAALSPQSLKATEMRVDYRFDDDTAWTTLGRMNSVFGGFLRRGISAVGRTAALEGVHGDPDRTPGDIPSLICRHEHLGIQRPAGGGDEVVMAYKFDARLQSFALRRPAPREALPVMVSPSHAYRVHAVNEEGCFEPSLFYEALDAATRSPSGLYLPAAQVPYLPYFFTWGGVQYVIEDAHSATDEPGQVLTGWEAA